MDTTTYNIVLLFHILAVVTFFSGIAVAGVAFESARRRPRPSEVAVLLSLSRVGVALVGIGGLALPLLGLWLVDLGHWGYGTGWVDWALGLYVLMLAFGGVGGRRPRQARLRAAELAAAGHDGADPQLRALLDDRLSRGANNAALVVALAILTIMVLK